MEGKRRMTVYESLVNWLNEILQDPKNNFPNVYTVIDLEMIPDWREFENAGIFSSPNDLSAPLIAGKIKHTDFKSFYLRRSFKEFTNRLENETFFEKFKACFHEKNLDCIMPEDGREWASIELNGGIYPAQRQENNEYADYLVPLKLVYIE
jgi:hypothetical protein